MNKVIWSIWFQGLPAAPGLVRCCIDSWQKKNPTWEVRCLDARTLPNYIPIEQHVDLAKQTITHASLSDIARSLLLHEYGGVWVDATTVCSRALDDWLPNVFAEGFFAFDTPSPDRPLASWFLAAAPGNAIAEKWCARTLRYWRDRTAADHYFWFHYLFKSLIEEDDDFRSAWSAVPKISADGPHTLQAVGLHRDADEVVGAIDWSVPVFKLTHRVDKQQIGARSLLARVLGPMLFKPPEPTVEAPSTPVASDAAGPFASLKVSTNNVGDHIQIIACNRLLQRFGVTPDYLIDRDDEIGSAPSLPTLARDVPIVLNGWFKRNGQEWPPNARLDPLFIGFHIRQFQCPELTSPAGLSYLRKFEPIGCRDSYTSDLLASFGVEAYISQCLSLTFPRRLGYGRDEGQVFVVSRDDRLLHLLPPEYGPYTFVSHYTDTCDFESNLREAERLLDVYRKHARLIVTSLLHCALPAIAMGIPVIVFYPINDEAGHQSDLERFSSLEQLIRVYRVDEMRAVDWAPLVIDVSTIKLALRDRLAAFLENRHVSRRKGLGPIAASSALPPP